MAMMTNIRERREALAAQLKAGQQQYAQLEQMLRDLDRQLCAMAGGLQELDALLAQESICAPPES